MAARKGEASSRRQKSKQRILSVLNCFARAMQEARTSSWFLEVGGRGKGVGRCVLNLERGAPGQSTLKSGIAMSVTRRLYLARMACARETSSGVEVGNVLSPEGTNFHHCRPKSFEATEQA